MRKHFFHETKADLVIRLSFRECSKKVGNVINGIIVWIERIIIGATRDCFHMVCIEYILAGRIKSFRIVDFYIIKALLNLRNDSVISCINICKKLVKMIIIPGSRS